MYKYCKYSFTSKVLINKSNEIVKVVSVNRNKYKKHVNLNEEQEKIIFERLKYKCIKNLLKGKTNRWWLIFSYIFWQYFQFKKEI